MVKTYENYHDRFVKNVAQNPEKYCAHLRALQIDCPVTVRARTQAEAKCDSERK